MTNPFPDKKIMCHRTGFTRSCFDIVSEGQCRLYTMLRGMDNNTGEMIDRWGCADEFIIQLTVENTNMQRQTGAAIESFRNEVAAVNGFPNGHPMLGNTLKLIR